MGNPFAALEEPVLESLNKLQADFRNDTRPHKVDLMVGSYRSDDGAERVFESVRLAKERLYKDPTWSHAYPSTHLGEPAFRKASLKLLFGDDSPLLLSNRVASMQALGGSGACHMGAVWLKKYYYPSESPKVYIPKEAWANHANVFASVGLQVRETLPYFNHETKNLDAEALLAFAQRLPKHSTVVLQVCGNNPTGCDLPQAAWNRLVQVMKQNDLLAFLDIAYQGFASGDVERDAEPIRILAAHDVPLVVAVTYSKAFGLYGERVGQLCVTAPDAQTAEVMERHMLLLARAETGAQPRFGALLVSIILEDVELTARWKSEIKEMAENLRERREALLKEIGKVSSMDWSFAAEQRGMFLYGTLLSRFCLKDFC
ncbi:hypothetical protein DV736_g6156, partial [Chaetothyriales sp. CBS 134916]